MGGGYGSSLCFLVRVVPTPDRVAGLCCDGRRPVKTFLSERRVVDVGLTLLVPDPVGPCARDL